MAIPSGAKAAAGAAASRQSGSGDGSSGRPTKILPTDRVAYAKQLTLLKAYAAVSGQSAKAVSVPEVAAVAKLNASTVSLCNAFFVDVGLLTRSPTSQLVPSSEVISFLRASQWNPDTAGQRLAPLLRETWFARRLRPRLSMGAMDLDDAIAELADEAAAGPKYRNGLELLLEYLQTAGILTMEGDVLREGITSSRGGESDTMSREASATSAVSSVSVMPTTDILESRNGSLVTSFMQPTAGVIQFQVNVQVDMSEFRDWSPARITSFFAGIAQVLAAKGRLESEST